jgi:acyl-CoA thioesterase
VPPGTVEIEVQVLRAGRAAMQMEARLLDAGQTAAVMLAVFGAPRESAVQVDPPEMAPALNPDDSPEVPFVSGMSPSFAQHYVFRWAEGGVPFSGSTDRLSRIHLRQRDEGLLDEYQIVALADAIPPPAVSLLDTPTTLSSLTWGLEFVRHPPPLSSKGWWRVDASVVSAHDGYSSQDAHLFEPGGELVALSRQLVAVFG